MSQASFNYSIVVQKATEIRDRAMFRIRREYEQRMEKAERDYCKALDKKK